MQSRFSQKLDNKDFSTKKTMNIQLYEKQSIMALLLQFHYPDWLSKQRFRERVNHTINLYWFNPQEDIHLVVLRPLKTSFIENQVQILCTNNSLKLYYFLEPYKRKIKSWNSIDSHKTLDNPNQGKKKN